MTREIIEAITKAIPKLEEANFTDDEIIVAMHLWSATLTNITTNLELAELNSGNVMACFIELLKMINDAAVEEARSTTLLRQY